MRYIGDDINILGMMQVIKPLRLRLRLRSRLEFEVRNGFLHLIKKLELDK